MTRFEHLFIVTYGRSGSTLLQKILNSIDGYLIRGENYDALFGLYQSYLDAKRTLEHVRDHGGAMGTGDPWFGGNGIDPDRYGDGLVKLFRREILRPGENDRVCGFKEIRFFDFWDKDKFKYFEEYLMFINQFFNNSCFIFNKRDPIEVSQSGWWKKENQEEVVNFISLCDEYMHNYQAKHSDNSIILDYNSYISDVNILRELFDFIGEDFKREKIETILNKKLTHCKT